MYLYAVIRNYTHWYGFIKFWSKCHYCQSPIIAFDQNLKKAFLCITKPIIMVQTL